MSAFERSGLMREAGDILRSRVDQIATAMSMERGKTFAEAKRETPMAPENIEQMAEEGRRAYCRVIPVRQPSVYQMPLRDPFRQAVTLLRSIPGVSDLTDQVIVSEIGTDMGRFPTAGHLVS